LSPAGLDPIQDGHQRGTYLDEISQNMFNPATNTCRCPKSGASSTLCESQLQFWTTAVILYCWFGHKSTGGNLKRGPIQEPLWPCLVPVDPLVCTMGKHIQRSSLKPPGQLESNLVTIVLGLFPLKFEYMSVQWCRWTKSNLHN
jgi:hypothetical protein